MNLVFILPFVACFIMSCIRRLLSVLDGRGKVTTMSISIRRDPGFRARLWIKFIRRNTHKTDSCIHGHIFPLNVLVFLLDSQIVSLLVNYKLQQNNPLKYSGRLGAADRKSSCCKNSFLIAPEATRNHRLYFRIFHGRIVLNHRNCYCLHVSTYSVHWCNVIFQCSPRSLYRRCGERLNMTSSKWQYEIFHKMPWFF